VKSEILRCQGDEVGRDHTNRITRRTWRLLEEEGWIKKIVASSSGALVGITLER
jgi:hypothetical protein